MNKTAIRNFAVSARVSLINAVTQRAFEYEVTEDGKNDPSQTEANGITLSDIEKHQRAQLIAHIKSSGFAHTMEEAAYTWFNRFIALRFMEVNNYLKSKTRVFSDESGNFKPEILDNAINVEIDGLDRERVLELLEKQDNEALYKYLLITQCNALNDGLPEMFEQIGGWTELLFPANLLRQDSVIAHLVNDIPKEDWQEQVQIIGWLYQYYNTEPKDKVFADLKKNIKISAAAIPAATQLFTPDWIVRYMVENSLGRLWVEGHAPSVADATPPSVREAFPEWKYYLEEAEQGESVKAELEKLRTEYRNIKPEDIKVIDPCMGSGHILVYAFDVLMQIYTSCGVQERDAALSILKNNLYGLDIDRRAYQLAYFAVMMKARQYNRRVLDRENQPNLANFSDVSGIDTSMLTGPIKAFAEQFADADTYGSLMEITAPAGLDVAVGDFSVAFGLSRETLDKMMLIYRILSQKYDVVCTNPPYMGGSGMNAKLSDFVKNNFADYKSDLFSAFVVKCTQLAKPTGYTGFLTPYVWMFIQSYEKLRSYIYSSKTIETLIQFEYSAFEEATVPICTFVLKNSHVNKNGCYFRLTDFRGGMEVQRQKTLEAIADHKCGFYYESNSGNFSKIPGMPVAYWVSEAFVRAFENETLYNYSISPSQNITGNNNKYVRKFWELDRNIIGGKDEWIFYAKGGGFRKWWGNLTDVVNWTPEARTIYQYGDGKHASQIINKDYWYRKGITWGLITSAIPSFRIMPEGATFDKGGSTIIVDDNAYLFSLGLLNSKVYLLVATILNPTLNFQVKDVCSMPLIINEKEIVNNNVLQNVELSKKDWDSFETSWDFEGHPLI